MGFTTPCFIRKNTEELRKRLEELGYSLCPGRVFDQKCLATSAFHRQYMSIPEEIYDSTDPHVTYNCANRKDCGTNEELFLAIAALRDDTDKNQWFTDGYLWFKCGDEMCDETIEYYLNKYGRKFHKATVEELINHFNNKR